MNNFFDYDPTDFMKYIEYLEVNNLTLDENGNEVEKEDENTLKLTRDNDDE